MRHGLMSLMRRLRDWRKSAMRDRVLLTAAMESTDEGILVVAREGHILAINRRFRELWRIPQAIAESGQDETLLGFVLDQLIDPEEFLGRVRQLYDSEAESRDTLHFKDGRVFARYSRPLSPGSKRGRIWCFKDITEQVNTEQALRKSEQKLLDILENVDACIYLKDTEGRYLFANRPVRELWQASMEDIVGASDEKFFDAATVANIRQNDHRVLADGETLRAEEINTVPLTGKTVAYQSTKLPLREANGNIYALCGISVDITQRLEAERLLKQLNADLAATLGAIPDLLFELDESGQYHNVWARTPELLAAQREKLLARKVNDVLPAAAAETVMSALREADEKGITSGQIIQLELPQGSHWFELSTSVKKAPDGAGKRFIMLSRDITEKKVAEERLHLASMVFTHAREGIMVTDAAGKILDVNNAFTTITGFGREEAIGQTPRILNSGRHGKAYFAAMWRALAENGNWDGEVWNRRKNGELFAIMQTVSAIHDEEGKVRQYVSLFSDITHIKEHEAQLERIAHYDSLTALPNRLLFADRLRQAMLQTIRRKQRLAVVYLDLDGFKAINDHHGHDAGDMLLMHVASRMRLVLREGDTLSRIGGDEFVAVLPDMADVSAGSPLLARLLAAAAEPVKTDGYVLQVSASLGITFFPQTEDVDADQLLRQADQAMYQAKLLGKNRYHIFDAEKDRSVRGHHDTLARIRQALSLGEFVLYYQPKVNMRSGTLVGAEALIRWQHPENGFLHPAEFLPAIEDHPLAIDLGEWVIDTALAQIESWLTEGLDIPVSVNICALHLQQANFVARLRELLAAHPRVQPSRLMLEVLETSAIEDIVLVSQVIEDCREIGVVFALDDFGTGYSSLSYLKRLPVGEIKIDQSFVRDMLQDPEDLAIVEGVLSFAMIFQRQAVAEGVETEDHGVQLLQLGCEVAQGYGIARPMPAAALPAWVDEWQPYASWRKLRSVNRDDLPLLVAGVEHRAWIGAMESYLRDEREAPPPVDHHLCRFGQWLDMAGRQRHGEHPVFHTADALHRQLHERANELLKLKAAGQVEEMQSRLGELHVLRDGVLTALKQLLFDDIA